MSGWQLKRLEECLERVKSPSKVQRKDFLDAGTYPIVSQEQEFINGYWYDEQDVFRVKKPVVIFGDHTKVLKYVDFDFVIGADGVKVLQPKSFLDPKFFFYFLNAFPVKALGYARHYRLLRELKVSYPDSLPEQKRIVGILDEAFAGIDAAIANTEKNLANARELFESYLNAVFTQKGDGWVEKTLSNVCSITSKLVDPRDPEFIDLPHLGAGNMVSRTGELIEIQTAREEGLISGKFLFDEKMVLYSKIRPYLMKACMPDFKGLCSADVYPLSPIDGSIDRSYLFHLLMSKHFTAYAIEGSGRAGMPKVNRNHLFKYRVSLPDIAEQRKFAAKFDDLFAETMRLEAIYQQKLKTLAELKQSILNKAFSGEPRATPKKSPEEAVA